MKNFSKLLLVTLITFSKIQGYIYSVSKLNLTKLNNITCFADIHYGGGPKTQHPNLSFEQIISFNNLHAQQIHKFIEKNFDKSNSLLIVEDIYDCNLNKELKNFYDQRWEANLTKNFSNCMSFLTKKLNANNISVYNVEFRQIFNIFFNFFKINAKQFLNYFYETIEQIKKYNDNEFLNNIYSKAINNLLETNKEFLDFLKQHQNQLAKEFIFEDKQNDVNNLLNDTHRLIDLKILHVIYNNKDKENIFICAGNKHIEETSKILEQMGYILNYKVESSSKFEPMDDISKLGNLEPINPLKSLDSDTLYFNDLIVLALSIIIVFSLKFSIDSFAFGRIRNNYL